MLELKVQKKKGVVAIMDYDKKSVLNNDADIYKHREEKTLKETLSTMTLIERASYLWEYYKIIAIIVLLSILFIVYILATIFKPKTNTKLNVTIIDNVLSFEEIDSFKNDLYSRIDNIVDQDEIMINSSLVFNSDPITEFNSRQALIIFLTSNEIDVLIAPESEILNYAQQGVLAPLTDELPADLNKALTNDLLYITLEESDSVAAYGVYLKNARFFSNYDLEEPLLLSIVSSSSKKNNAIECIRYFF